MKVKWVRGQDSITYNRPNIWFSLGVRDSGKSSFLEHTAENYLEAGHAIFDLFGSRDGEGLAWLRSSHIKDKKVLLLRGDNVDVECCFPVKSADSVTLSDFETNDIIISSSPLYQTIDQEFNYAAHLTDLLYKRMHYKRLVFAVVREASNLYYSRLKISDNQTFAKAEMTYLLRESRHMGLGMGLDSLRFYSLDIDIRSLTDYLLLKSQGMQGLSKDLKWLYRYVDPRFMRHMKQQDFVILTSRGSIGYGFFPYPDWHKKEKENILDSVGIKTEYGEVLKEAQIKGSFKTVSDREHTEIVRLYIEEDMGFNKIADKLDRSSRTIKLHVDSHNVSVQRSGFCAACKRAGSSYFNRIVEKGMV